ncbi:hypothetical protein D9M72_578550 [compost metagenome]
MAVQIMDVVRSRAVIGLRAAVADVDAESRAEPFGPIDPLSLGQHRHHGPCVTVNLGAVKN